MQAPGGLPVWRHAAGLTGRHSECGVLDQLVEAVRDTGESRALVVQGEPGTGKSALLEYLAGHAPGCEVARAAGVQSEMELAFAGCISCAHRCWTGWRLSRHRNATRSGPRSA